MKNNALLLIGGVVALYYLAGKKTMTTKPTTPQKSLPPTTPPINTGSTSGKRGIRNNNPGNIRVSKTTKWIGQIGDDGDFVIFSTPEYGIRAIYRTLLTYRRDHKLSTVKGIFERYAPPKENKTHLYIAFVCKEMGVGPDTVLALSDYDRLIIAIIKMENGAQPYTLATIRAGMALA